MLIPTFEIEREFINKGDSLIMGMDEAGRGPLAGPVVCAGIIIKNPEAFSADIIRDSKTLSAAQRKKAFQIITKNAYEISFSIVDNKYIDQNGIIRALEKGYGEVVDRAKEYNHILLDGDKKFIAHQNITTIVHGDSKSKTIAAASIAAKYIRDILMIRAGDIFPEYGFQEHKGYGTSRHIENIKRHGVCFLHRNSFLKLK